MAKFTKSGRKPPLQKAAGAGISHVVVLCLANGFTAKLPRRSQDRDSQTKNLSFWRLFPDVFYSHSDVGYILKDMEQNVSSLAKLSQTSQNHLNRRASRCRILAIDQLATSATDNVHTK
jgi:hypothetical protein